MSDSWTHYDNLKVSPRADAEVIRAAYRALAQKWHPDKNPPDRKANCERIMHLINEAYRVLSDPASRAKYDESLAAARTQATDGHRTRRAPDRSEPPPDPSASASDEDIAGLSHYDLLDLAWDASVEQVDVARVIASTKWHPCLHPPEQKRTCERMQGAIERAAACLSDPAARRAYNGELIRRHPMAWSRAHERRRVRSHEPSDASGAEDTAREAAGSGAGIRPAGLRPRWLERSGDLIAALVESVRASLHGAPTLEPGSPAATPPPAGRDPGATAT